MPTTTMLLKMNPCSWVDDSPSAARSLVLVSGRAKRSLGDRVRLHCSFCNPFWSVGLDVLHWTLIGFG